MDDLKNIINNYYFNYCYSKNKILKILTANTGIKKESLKKLIDETINEYKRG